MKVAVFLPNWIGDAIMATPTLRALRRRFGPGARLVGILRPYVEEVLRGTPWLDEVWRFERGGRNGAGGILATAWRLFREGFDVAVLLPNNREVAYAAWLGRVRERVGYVRYRRGPLLTTRLHPPRDARGFTPHSTLGYYLEIAYALGCPEEPWRMELATSEEDERAADRAWAELGLRPAERVVVLNSSGAAGAAKLWPEERFALLGRRIAGELDHDALVLCGPAERERADRIARAAAHPRVVSLGGRPLSLGLSKACVRRARLLVSTDSAPRHMATAFGRPVVSIFGPNHPAWADTRDPRDRHVRIDVPCGPCQQPVCPEGHHRCMQDLPVDAVFEAVRRSLEEGG